MMISRQELFDDYLFVEAVVIDKSRVAFCAVHGPAKEDGVLISRIFYSDTNKWEAGIYHNMEVVSMACSPFSNDEVFILGREGECIADRRGHKRSYDIEITDEILGPFRKIRNIDGNLYILGENRSVWRLKNSIWIKLDQGISDEESIEDIKDEEFDEDEFLNDIIARSEVMFSISGSEKQDMCMVGTSGEIWMWDGSIWSAETSPTNLNLYDVHCVSRGRYVICGQNGTIIEGEKGKWRIIETDNEISNFCSVTKYKDKFYLADGDNLFELTGDTLEKVDFGIKDDEVPSHFVVSSEQLIVSVAAKEIFVSTNGVEWKSLLL